MFKHAIVNNPLKQFMGPGDGNIIQVNKDFTKTAGDKITFALRALDNSDGQGDDGIYEGNEAAMTFYDQSVQIHERGHSIKLNGKMTEQRTIIKLRPQAKNTLGEWLGRVQANDTICALSNLPTMQLAGVVTGATASGSASSTSPVTVNQTAIASGSAKRKFFGGYSGTTLTSVADDELITSATTHRFGTGVISHVKRMAQTHVEPVAAAGTIYSPLRPIMVDGKKMFVMLINRWQAKDLRNETAWLQAQREANLRGHKNPIFSGAMGIWDNVVIHECDYIHTRYGENGVTVSEYFDTTSDPCASGIYVARGLFLGAQAGLLAFGQLPSWVEKIHDYKTKYGVHTDVIYGVKKAVFNSIEFGCITVDTAISPT
jgi:hypothetical protein